MMTIEIDGVLRYTPEDVQTGLCEPHEVWRPVPPGAGPTTLSQPDGAPDASPPTAAQLRKDVLAAYSKLGGVAYLQSLAGDNPPAFLKLLVNALHHQSTDTPGADLSQLTREEHRRLQVAEQYAIINAHRPASLAGDAKASEVIIKAGDRLAKLLGTDQPRLVANFHSMDIKRLSDAELEALAVSGIRERGQEMVQREDGTYEVVPIRDAGE